VTYDLGARFDLAAMRVWNYNEAGQTNRGIQNMTVSFSNDGTTFRDTQSVTLDAASGASDYAGADYAFSGLEIGYRYIKFGVSSNLGSTFATGLSEVRFNTTTAELTPVSVSVNQTANGGASFALTNIVNDGGMGGFDDERSIAHTNVANSYLWRQRISDGNAVSNSVITFDLGAGRKVGAVKIWNYHEKATVWKNDRGLQNVELWQSDDGVSYSKVGDYTLDQQGNETNTSLHTVLDLFDAGVDARYLQLRADDNYGDASIYGLGEVRFYAAATAPFLTPVNATSPNVADAHAPLVSMINHYGLATNGTHTATYRDGSIYYHWRTQETPNTVSVTYDLGARFDLAAMRVWNYNEAGQTNRGIQNMTVSFSNDGTTFRDAQSVTLVEASGLDTYAGADYAFSGLEIGYRYIKFDVSSNLGSTFKTGLAEVRFNTTTAELTPVSVSVNQTANGGAKFAVGNLVDGSGMTGFGNEQSDVFTGTADVDKLWRQNSGADGNVIANSELTFDLGSKQKVGAVKIWNYHEKINTTFYNVRGLQNVELYQSDDDSTYTKVGDYTVGKQLEQDRAVDHTVLDLSGEGVNAQYLQIRATDNYGDAYYGLGEVRFYAAAITPASGSIILLR
jgi:hypothetical protein